MNTAPMNTASMNIVLVAWFVVAPLAAKAPNPADVKPGWLGFVMFLALAAATVLLWLSFRKHLKRINFDEEPDEPRGQAGDR